jgi:hypothetical protein
MTCLWPVGKRLLHTVWGIPASGGRRGNGPKANAALRTGCRGVALLQQPGLCPDPGLFRSPPPGFRGVLAMTAITTANITAEGQ